VSRAFSSRSSIPYEHAPRKVFFPSRPRVVIPSEFGHGSPLAGARWVSLVPARRAVLFSNRRSAVLAPLIASRSNDFRPCGDPLSPLGIKRSNPLRDFNSFVPDEGFGFFCRKKIFPPVSGGENVDAEGPFFYTPDEPLLRGMERCRQTASCSLSLVFSSRFPGRTLPPLWMSWLTLPPSSETILSARPSGILSLTQRAISCLPSSLSFPPLSRCGPCHFFFFHGRS